MTALATAEERERFYDDEIAPVLADLSKRCFEAGLSFLTIVEWKVGTVGRTAGLQAERGSQIDWAHAAAMASGNADSLIMYIMRQAAKRGHLSMCLTVLGVPTSPAAGKTVQ